MAVRRLLDLTLLFPMENHRQQYKQVYSQLIEKFGGGKKKQ